MREHERMIIGSAYGENQYKKLSFLECTDFNNYPGEPFRLFWKILEGSNGYNEQFIRRVYESKNHELISLMSSNCFIPIVCNAQRAGMYLIQEKFKSLFSQLLFELSSKSKNETEKKLLDEAYMECNRIDIFSLSDGVLEYIGVHASELSKNRINAFLKYRDARAKKVKNVIN